MKILKLEQGSEEWLAHRKTCITSTDAAAIMGMNPYKSRKELLREKLNIEHENTLTEKMKEGLEWEEEARNLYMNKTSTIVTPYVGVHDEYFWAMASLDGVEQQREFILEIKCGESAYNKACKNEVPPYYYVQIQHALWVSGCRLCHYWCYRREMPPILIPITADDLFISRMIEEEKAFYHEMITLHPDDIEVKEMKDEEMRLLIEKYDEAKSMKQRYETLEKEYKEAIINLCADKDTVAFGYSISKSYVKGAVQYETIPELKNVNLEYYRSPARFQWSIRAKKEGT